MTDIDVNTLCNNLFIQLTHVESLIFTGANIAGKFYPIIKIYFEKKDYTVILLDNNRIEISKSPEIIINNAEFMKTKADNYWSNDDRKLVDLVEIMGDIENVSNKGIYHITYIIIDKGQENNTSYKFIYTESTDYLIEALKNLNFTPSVKDGYLYIYWA